MAEYGALDQNTWIDAHRSRGIWSTGSSSNARDDFATVDLINEIRRLRFDLTFGESKINMWLLKENQMKIGQAIIMGS